MAVTRSAAAAPAVALLAALAGASCAAASPAAPDPPPGLRATPAGALAALPPDTWPTLTPPRPAGGGFRLLALGDTGEPGPDMDKVTRAVRATPADAVIVLGDLVYEHAPACPPAGPGPDERAIFDAQIANAVGDPRRPVYLAIGNHDVAWSRDPDYGLRARELCYVAWAAGREDVVMPGVTYAVDLGAAVMVVVDSNHLDAEQAAFARATWAAHPDARRILAAHHVLRTFRDKEGQDLLRPWLVAHDLKPELVLSGHAHILQFGIYDGLPAVTSGATSRVRPRAPCPGRCGAGERFGQSTPGFAVISVAADGQLGVAFEDTAGRTLFAWTEPPRAPLGPDEEGWFDDW